MTLPYFLVIQVNKFYSMSVVLKYYGRLNEVVVLVLLLIDFITKGRKWQENAIKLSVNHKIAALCVTMILLFFINSDVGYKFLKC